MKFRGVQEMRVSCFVVTVLVCATAAIAAMKIATTTVPLPDDEKPVLLSGLEYPGAGWTVALTSMWLEIDSAADADPVQAVWTMVGSSSRPMVQKVIVEVFLQDGAGKNLKTLKKFIVVKSNVERQEFPVKMKVKRADWERAERVLIKTTFTVL